MWRVFPAVLSIGLLGAHFFRAGAQLPVLACLAVLAVMAIPRPWAARVVQVSLVLGTLEWLRTLVTLASARAAAGEPAARLVAILGTVAAVSLVSALVFRNVRVRNYYGLGTSGR